jgi:hypothetical protein
VQVLSKSISNGSTLLLRSIQVFVPISPGIAARRMKHQSLDFLHMCYKGCMFGRFRLVMKGTLVSTSNKFLFPVSPRIAAGRLKMNTWHSLSLCAIRSGSLVEIGRNEVQLSLKADKFFRSSGPSLCSGRLEPNK